VAKKYRSFDYMLYRFSSGVHVHSIAKKSQQINDMLVHIDGPRLLHVTCNNRGRIVLGVCKIYRV